MDDAVDASGLRGLYAGQMEIDETFEPMTDNRAREVLAELWGIEAQSLDRLDTERDDSFHVTSAAGEYVLKVAHPDDDELAVNLQTAAMSFASELEPRLPLQRILLSRQEDVESEADGRIVRLLTWLPGAPFFDTTPTGEQLGILGETLGRLSQALFTFDHPAAHRDFVWDAARLDLVRPLAVAAAKPEIDAAFDLYDAHSFEGLPRQVIHNDFHPGNVLVDAASPDYVTGVLDFGDVNHSLRVADLAIALSYLRTPLHVDADAFIAGFERVVRLTPAEHEALPALIAARFAQRYLINRALDPDNPYGDQNLGALRTLLEES